MAEKLSWTELRHLLATRAGVSEKEANIFLSAFNAQIVEALKQDKQVKVNGLGTFRLQAVAPRKSVNVTSGEEITIDGYNKIAFTPEVSVKELVENVPATPQPIETDEEINPLKKLGDQAEEIVDILADLGQSPAIEGKEKTVPQKRKKKTAAVTVAEEQAAEPEKTVDAPVEKNIVAEPVAQEPEKLPVTPISIKEEPKAIIIEKKTENEKKEKKRYHFLRDTLICVIILLLLLLIGYFFLRSQLTNWINSLGKEDPVLTENIEPIATDTIIAEEITSPANETAATEEPQEKTYELITTEEMHEASRLTWMAYRYYGSKAYWPYIYDANKDHINNPNKIVTGTPIRIPKLSAEEMDTTIERSRIRLQQLREAAEAACKK